MKRTTLILLLAALAAVACSKKPGGGTKLKADTDSVAYILGMNVGLNLMRMDSTLNATALCEGIRDVFRAKTRLSEAEAQAYFLRYMNHTLPERARAYEEQFIEDIVKSNRSYARTSSGVAYTVSEVGDQNRIPSSDRDSVLLRRIYRTADGTELYSSYARGDTLRTTLGELTLGERECVKLIGRGGRVEAWIPSKAAYGDEGDKTLGVAPNTTLYCEIELVGVEPYSNRYRKR